MCFFLKENYVEHSSTGPFHPFLRPSLKQGRVAQRECFQCLTLSFALTLTHPDPHPLKYKPLAVYCGMLLSNLLIPHAGWYNVDSN